MKASKIIREELRRYKQLLKSHVKEGYYRDAWQCEKNVELLLDLLEKMADASD